MPKLIVHLIGCAVNKLKKFQHTLYEVQEFGPKEDAMSNVQKTMTAAEEKWVLESTDKEMKFDGTKIKYRRVNTNILNKGVYFFCSVCTLTCATQSMKQFALHFPDYHRFKTDSKKEYDYDVKDESGSTDAECFVVCWAAAPPSACILTIIFFEPQYDVSIVLLLAQAYRSCHLHVDGTRSSRSCEMCCIFVLNEAVVFTSRFLFSHLERVRFVMSIISIALGLGCLNFQKVLSVCFVSDLI